VLQVENSVSELKKLTESYLARVSRLRVRRETLERWIRESLGYLIRVVEAKRALVVRSRDIERYLGVRDQNAKMRLSLVLGLLSEIGLAKRLGIKRSPLHTLIPRSEWRAFIETCGEGMFRCVEGEPCQLVGTCPYWRLISYIEASSLKGEIRA